MKLIAAYVGKNKDFKLIELDKLCEFAYTHKNNSLVLTVNNQVIYTKNYYMKKVNEKTLHAEASSIADHYNIMSYVCNF